MENTQVNLGKKWEQIAISSFFNVSYNLPKKDDDANTEKQKRSTEGCSKFKSPEKRQVQERFVSTLEHVQVPKWDRTRCPEE